MVAATVRGVGFERVSALVLERVRDGASFDEACRLVGVNVRTGRDWAHRGRKDPEGRYGDFARKLDEIRNVRRLPSPDARGALSRDEWESALAKAVRGGSVPAMRLWFETHVTAAGDEDVDRVLDFVPRSYGGRA